MLKRKKIKALYMLESICDKCGSPMESTGIVLSTWPTQYPYKCTNENCDGSSVFYEHECPGRIIYEFEEDNFDV